MWSRVLARSGLDVCFSEGYNPHPRLSLPLPRSVGVRSDDERLCATIFANNLSPVELAARIRSCLPKGCVITDVELCGPGVSLSPAAAVYELPLRSSVEEEIRRRVDQLNTWAVQGRAVIVERQSKGRGPTSQIDVGAYIASATMTGNIVSVDCRITPAGTVRVDEIMQLLGLDAGDIQEGVLRKSVQWNNN